MDAKSDSIYFLADSKNSIYIQQAVWIDKKYHLPDVLHRILLVQMLFQARHENISTIAAISRPRFIDSVCMAYLPIYVASAVLLKKFTCIHHVTMLLYTTVYWALLLSEDEN